MVSSEDSENALNEQPCFDNPSDEAVYWKQIAEDYLQKLQDVREEFEEFQEGSRELEAELEVQLEQYENRVSDLTSTKTRLEDENQLLKEKIETIERKTYAQITELQDQNVQITTVRDEMTKYIRELEQCNDDLERAKRATICSLEEFDARLNNAIERNAFLENELEEKEQLIITVQRLKDESRDLKSELAIGGTIGRKSSLNESKMRLEETQTNASDSSMESKKQKAEAASKNPNYNETDRSKIINPTGIINHKIPSKQNMNSSMSPSARISALNIVNDLLRKVGALETKLDKCRNFVQDSPQKSNMQLPGANTIHMNGVGIAKKATTNSGSTVSGLVKTSV